MSDKKKNTSTNKKGMKTDTTSVSIINTKELNSLIEEDIESGKEVLRPKKHLFVHLMLILLLFVSLGAFGFVLYNKDSSIYSIIMNLLITIFTILFVVVSITYKRNDKSLILISCIILLSYFIFGFSSTFFRQTTSLMPNFSGKSITEVMKWANANKMVINQEYEYSDMIDEYSVISQSIPAGDKITKDNEVTVSVSEGPNPSKEIMVPNMISWDTERVIKFIKANYLSNVEVEFVQSDKAKDTVIEQSASGSLKRDDSLKLTFSYGEELESQEVVLIDFTNKSKFEVEFYMKQHQLKYSFVEEFEADIRRGYAFSQNVKAGDTAKINDTEVIVTISKGPEIKVPDFTKYSMEEASLWAIKNKVKMNFTNQYDDTIVENHIISANYEEGEIIEQGSVVKLVISRGHLKMRKFSSLDEFYVWADQYSIDYEETHEFSDSVAAGEVISYSYKEGEIIKNKDTIVIKISDGVKIIVPNVVSLTRSEAISKLDKAGLKYYFIYKNNSATKDKVLSQSIRSGSEVSKGTTITVTLSNGKEETNTNNNSGGNNNTTPTTDPTPQPTCNACNIRASQITSTLQQYTTYESAASGLKSYLQGLCPGLTVNIIGKTEDGYGPGDFIGGFEGGNTDSCSTISITLAK